MRRWNLRTVLLGGFIPKPHPMVAPTKDGHGVPHSISIGILLQYYRALTQAITA